MTPPPSDVRVDLGLALRLLTDQHPDLAEQAVRIETEGWDNAIFRIGEDLAARIPRRGVAATLIDHEQRWLPKLAPLLPIPIPAPVRNGRPTGYFPYAWSVVPWVEGRIALHEPLAHSEAQRLGEFLAQLHTTDIPPEPPTNPYRGGPLPERWPIYQQRLDVAGPRLGGQMTEATYGFLENALNLTNQGPATWLHGDLHSKNVVARNGRIVTIIDWGDICTGDPATDLASLWILFPPSAHKAFWSAYGTADPDLVTRSRAWAIAFGLMIYESHHEADPAFASAGLETIERAVLGT